MNRPYDFVTFCRAVFRPSEYEHESELFFNACHLLPPANEVWGKVIFLHLFVIVFMGGLCLSARWDTTATPQNHAPPGTMHPSPAAEHAGRYGQRAGSTHSTGMQSCSFIIFACSLIFSPVAPAFVWCE